MLNTLSSVSVRESRIQYLCDPQWFRDTASRGPTTIVAPESQFRTCPTDHDSIGYPRMSASGESSTTIHRLLHASGSHPIPTPYDPKSENLGSDTTVGEPRRIRITPPGEAAEEQNLPGDDQYSLKTINKPMTFIGRLDHYLLATRARLRPVSRGNRHFTYGPFNPYIPIRSTTIGKSRVAIDPIAMHKSWRSNSDITSVTSIGYPRMSASGESSTTINRLLHASGSHPIPTPYDPKSNRNTYPKAQMNWRTLCSTVAKIFGCTDSSRFSHTSIYNSRQVSIKRAKQDELSTTSLTPNNGAIDPSAKTQVLKSGSSANSNLSVLTPRVLTNQNDDVPRFLLTQEKRRRTASRLKQISSLIFAYAYSYLNNANNTDQPSNVY
ncbi:hypothetical protein F511_31681 [Dorcoceras hygrometricum]|uniref:Uncharacterized protein n=1 Tax=Dorcoceras hygrometricum TaxID=472368 RepID=A0A2Z7ABS3_9LAMI|nr:hypothetical protein F511_31681 [Dorcoceras hygrometricum]